MSSNHKINEIFLLTEGLKNYVKVVEVSKSAPNIIFIMTPIASVGEELAERFLEGLTCKTCNVFALDFLGIGQSEGTSRHITVKNMIKSTLSLIEYIKNNYNEDIHFYGGTGAGGIIGQAIVSSIELKGHITSFIQYGVGIYSDTTTMGKTELFKKLWYCLKILNKLIPGVRIKFNIPEYDGINSEEERQWYLDVQKKEPKAFDFKISLFKAILDIFFRKDSSIINSVTCPVLVIAPMHDRYYYKDYFDRYFKGISSSKELHWIDGSHISFDWMAKEINSKVLEWVNIHSEKH